MEMDETKKQRLLKLIKMVIKALPLYMVFFYMTLLPLPHIVRLAAFFVVLSLNALGFVVTGLLIWLLITKRDTMNEKTRRILKVMAVASPIVDVALLVVLVGFVWPGI